MPKSNTYSVLKPLLGTNSMISQDGTAWKAIRERINPGFQPRDIHSFMSSVIDQVEIFKDRLRELAESGDTFRLADYAQDPTTDIITQLTIGRSFNAQSAAEGQGEKPTFGKLTISRRLGEMVYAAGQGIGFHMINPIRPFKLLLYEKIFNYKLRSIVKASITLDTLSASTSILHLAISNLSPNKNLLQNCVDQIKTFLFAGTDTTAILIQWICYEMSKASPTHFTILSNLRQEHNKIFGPHPFSALQLLSSLSPSNSESLLSTNSPTQYLS